MTRKLYRSKTDQMIAGVCGGLAAYLNIDSTLIRLLFVLAVLTGFGTGVVLYIILMIIIPLEGETGVTFTAPSEPPKDTGSGDTPPSV